MGLYCGLHSFKQKGTSYRLSIKVNLLSLKAYLEHFMTTLELDIVKLPFSEVREVALDFLEQAYQTDPNEHQSRERANRLEGLIMSRVKDLTQKLSQSPETLECIIEKYIEDVVTWGLHLSQCTYTGFYSLTINRALRKDAFYELPPTQKVKIFPELYCNQRLSEEEKCLLEQRYQNEFAALKEAFYMGEYCQQPQFFRDVTDTDLEDADCFDLYSECYNRLMNSNGAHTSYSCPLYVQLLIEFTHEYTDPYVIFEIPTKELLLSMLTDKINPETGFSYDPATVNKVRSKFSTELKLIQFNLPQLSEKCFQ